MHSSDDVRSGRLLRGEVQLLRSTDVLSTRPGRRQVRVPVSSVDGAVYGRQTGNEGAAAAR